MAREKIKPRVFSAGYKGKEHSFLYRFLSSQRFLAIIGLVFLILIALPLARTYSQKKVLEKELTDLRLEIDRYEKESSDLEEVIKYLNSDQSLESQARLNLNLKKPEETVVVIEKNNNQETQSELELNRLEKKNNLQNWWQYFFAS